MAFTKKEFIAFEAPVGRMSFPSILKPSLKYQSKTEYEYSTQLLWSEKTSMTALEKAIERALIQEFGEDKAKWPKNIVTPLNDTDELIRDLEAKGKSVDHLEAGGHYARFKTGAVNEQGLDAKGKSKAPKVWDALNNNVTIESNEKNEVVYGGAYAAIIGNVGVYTMAPKKPLEPVTYVTFYIQGVKIFGTGDKAGKKFGGSPITADAFSAAKFDGDDVDPAFNSMM